MNSAVCFLTQPQCCCGSARGEAPRGGLGRWTPGDGSPQRPLAASTGPVCHLAQGKGGGLGSYLGEHKAVIVRVPGVLGLIAHGVEKEDSHDLRGTAA